MRHARFLLGLMAGSVLLAGCMRPFFTGTSSRATDPNATPAGSSAVAVRFFMPPDAERLAAMHPNPAVQLVGDPGSTGFANENQGEAGTPSEPDSSVMHVALWGGPYYGHETTFSLTSLQPGDYTFAMIDQDKAKAIQGWIHVNFSDTDLADILQRWKAEMPKMKQWLAYDFELQGKLNTADAEVFKSFARQLRAFERLERELDQAIQHEWEAQASARQRNDAFLHNAEVLLFPGDHSFFRPTTKPAFTKEEIEKVRDGDPASKMVLVADYPTAQWKLRLVNQLTNELQRCKAVFVEEADRLARRKRFYTLTDHIYNHDRKFVENEMRLQQCLASIDRMNQQIAQLGERRMALAFITGLFAPEDSMAALNRQEYDLVRERAVLETQKERFDTLFQQTDEDSARRVVFERGRQDTVRAIENVNTQLAKLSDARNALQKLRNRTEVIYRQGDQAMVAASFFDTDVPFPFRQTVEREALMSVRVEPTDSLHIPSIRANMAAMRHGAQPPQEQMQRYRPYQRHAVMHSAPTTWNVKGQPGGTAEGPVASGQTTATTEPQSTIYQTRVAQQRPQPKPQPHVVEPATVQEPLITPDPSDAVTMWKSQPTQPTTTQTAKRSPAAQPIEHVDVDEPVFDEPDDDDVVWQNQQQQEWQQQQPQPEPEPKQVEQPWQRQAATQPANEPSQRQGATEPVEHPSQRRQGATEPTDQPWQRQAATEPADQPWKQPQPPTQTRTARQAQPKQVEPSWKRPEPTFEPEHELDTRIARRAVTQPTPESEPVVRPSRSQTRTSQAKQTVTPEPVLTLEDRKAREERYLARRPQTVTEETRRHERTVYKRSGQPDTKLTSMHAQPKHASDRGPDRKAQPQDEDCPWIIKILVPPCWFLDKD